MGVTSSPTQHVKKRKQATATLLPSSMPILEPCGTRVSAPGPAASNAMLNEKFGGQMIIIII
jgi:hypothetical protein